ncbi:putative Late nodulin [Medicago truncatula]|uniref:Putative Late nodulin n=1 Tax=Medicago truncatula TaxID=3880 RepID=A0A396IAB4_MEDTR|nr:putative Late nodulin [Medicago truncatula]
MAKIIKFLYNTILFVCLFLHVTYGDRECVTSADCQKKYHGNQHLSKCRYGHCVSYTK